MSRLIVISNRVAKIEEGKSTSGGLAVGVLDTLHESGGVWFGWRSMLFAPYSPAWRRVGMRSMRQCSPIGSQRSSPSPMIFGALDRPIFSIATAMRSSYMVIADARPTDHWRCPGIMFCTANAPKARRSRRLALRSSAPTNGSWSSGSHGRWSAWGWYGTT